LLFGGSEEMAMSTAAMTSSTTLPLVPVTVEVCAGCRLPIEDRFLLRVMDNSWHEACLQCSACCEPLRQSCFVKDRRLLCRRDYDKYAASLLSLDIDDRLCITHRQLKADAQYPYIYGPYMRVVFTARMYGCIFDTRMYG